MLNLLAWFKFDVGEGAFYAVFGFLFVFLGIALLAAICTRHGLITKKVNARKPRVKKGKKPQTETVAATDGEETLSPQTVAAITAAVAMYFEQENVKCDFVVKRIKKL